MDNSVKVTKTNYSVTNVRVDVCVVITGCGENTDRSKVWSSSAENFIRLLQKNGVSLAVIGPKPPLKFTQKLGLKRSVHFFDRHEIINLKLLQAAKSHGAELRILNRKSKVWIRVRTEICLTVGFFGTWPTPFEGWASPGTLTLPALARWIHEYKWIPGREFAFIGSNNYAIRWATTLLDLGAKSCYIIEPDGELKCWKAHRDRFIRKGGRVFPSHRVVRAESDDQSVRALYLQNQFGTLILSIDTIVVGSSNEECLNDPEWWKKGLYYLQRRYTPWDTEVDEEPWLEDLDWKELYWRVLKQLGLADRGQSEGAIKSIKSDRKFLLEYRKPEKRIELGYSGKILDRVANEIIRKSESVPKEHFEKPLASLECFEGIPCRACADSCPEQAIEIKQLVNQPKLIESKCVGCGACVAACPAGAALMIQEVSRDQKVKLFLPDDTKEMWKSNRAVQILNRRGDVLGMGRTAGPSIAYENGLHRVLEIETSNVHMWEARGFRGQRLDNLSTTSKLESSQNPIHIAKKGWVQLNQARRHCPIDVPLTVALWQLGLRRFEEALFCGDGTCGMCEVLVNGKRKLACQTIASEGQDIRVPKPQIKDKCSVCPCNSVTESQINGLVQEKIPEFLIREMTGLGFGTCHGRWCLSFKLATQESYNSKQRPMFSGYETSPWRDLCSSDILDFKL